MIHFVLHDARDTVAVVVVEGVKAGMAMTGWIMDEDRMVDVQALQDIPIGHKVALADMAPGDTVLKYGIAMPALTPSTTTTATVSRASCNTK